MGVFNGFEEGEVGFPSFAAFIWSGSNIIMYILTCNM